MSSSPGNVNLSMNLLISAGAIGFARQVDELNLNPAFLEKKRFSGTGRLRIFSPRISGLQT